MKQDRYNKFQEGVKLIVLFQTLLEQMDTFKGTNLYKHSIKSKVNSLEKDIEQHIRKPLGDLDNINSELFDGIQERVELILDLSTEEIAQLKVVVEDHRKDWQDEILEREGIA
jgi:hypothetical protein